MVEEQRVSKDLEASNDHLQAPNTENDPQTTSDGSVLSEKPGEADAPQEPAKAAAPPNPDIPPEEGLLGWLAVVGCSCCLFVTFGFLNAIGVFQTYYESHILSEYTPSEISWIFAVQLWLMWFPGPLFGRVLDTYGPRALLIPSAILCVLGMCMTSLSKRYYEIMLSQGVCYGIGAGGAFATGMVCAGQWFVKRRGTAIGIVTAGSSLGGVIFPFFVTKVIEDVGFDGAVRYTALFMGILLSIAIVLCNPRLPKKKWDNKTPWVNFTLLKNPTFALYTFGSFFVFWGLWAPFDFIPSMAQATSNFSPDMSVYLIAIMNATSIPGRALAGNLGDKVGFFNLITVFSGAAGAAICLLWIPFNYHASHVGLIWFALVFGFLSGGFIALFMPCAARTGPLETLGQRFGTYQVILSFSNLTGLPIMGAILVREGNYLGLILWSTVTVFIGCALILGSRYTLAGFSSKKV